MASPLSLKIPPGYVKTDSVLASDGRYVDGDNVRFYKDRPQKIGGNIAATSVALAGGPIRGMHTWNPGSPRQNIAAGTAGKLYVITNDYQIITDITPTDYRGGFVDSVYGFGWGVGAWGVGTWGTRRPGSTSSILSNPTIWSFGNFGSILLASPTDNGLYAWNPATVPAVPAQAVDGAPDQLRGFWQTAERFTICYGCTGPNGEDVNLLRVSWSAQGDYTDWDTTHTPTELANLPGAPAGSRTLQFGQKVVAATDLGNLFSLIWTDAGLYTWQYVGGDFTFESKLVGQRCGLLSRYGFAVVAGQAYWLSSGNFWMYGASGLSLIPEAQDISEWFFGQIDQFQSVKAFAYYNVRFDEVWFVAVPIGMTEPALAAVYNRGQGKAPFWFHCSLPRSAATAFSDLDPNPILGGADGVIYQHETGLDNAGAALPWYLVSPYLELQDGAASIDIFGFMPDMSRQIGDVVLQINALDRTPEPQIDTETQSFGPTDGLVDFHLSGREVQMKLSCTEMGCDMRLGAPKVEFQQGGEQR